MTMELMAHWAPSAAGECVEVTTESVLGTLAQCSATTAPLGRQVVWFWIESAAQAKGIKRYVENNELAPECQRPRSSRTTIEFRMAIVDSWIDMRVSRLLRNRVTSDKGLHLPCNPEVFRAIPEW